MSHSPLVNEGFAGINNHDNHAPSFALLHQQPVLPKVGETRCYWTLLSSELEFVYLDPVLTSHLGAQADLIIGRSLLSFVHPDEQTSAKHDLGNVLKTRQLHGSVTRVRFSRLSSIRRQLGFKGLLPAFAQSPSDPTSKIAMDANYMAVDIVINWAAEGIVLCFVHAIVDLSPDDNDEEMAIRANHFMWTNWCGTPWMGVSAVRNMWQQLCTRVLEKKNDNGKNDNNETRVFQLLGNDSNAPTGGSVSGSRRPLLMSWPPDDASCVLTGADLAKLAEEVRIGGPHSTGDAKTGCTRRYKALQNIPRGQVESIFIPHGTIIFACHKLTLRPEVHIDTSGAYAGRPSNQGYPDRFYEYSATTSVGYDSGFQSADSPQPPPYSPGISEWSQVSNLRSNSANFPPPPPWNTASPGSDPYQQQQQHGATNTTTNTTAFPSHIPTANHPKIKMTLNNPDNYVPRRKRTLPNGQDEDTNMPQREHTGRSSGNRPPGVTRCTSCQATSSPEWRKGPSGKKELCNACGLRFARSRAKKDGSTMTQRRKAREAREKEESESKGILIAGGGTGQGGSKKGARKAAAAAAAAAILVNEPPMDTPPQTPNSANSSYSDMRDTSLMHGSSVSPGPSSGSGNESYSRTGFHQPRHQQHHHPYPLDRRNGASVSPIDSPAQNFASYAYHSDSEAPRSPFAPPHHGHGFYNVPSPLSAAMSASTRMPMDSSQLSDSYNHHHHFRPLQQEQHNHHHHHNGQQQHNNSDNNVPNGYRPLSNHAQQHLAHHGHVIPASFERGKAPEQQHMSVDMDNMRIHEKTPGIMAHH